MKIYVDDLPKTSQDCCFYINEQCFMCKRKCDVNNCYHLTLFSFGTDEEEATLDKEEKKE